MVYIDPRIRKFIGVLAADLLFGVLGFMWAEGLDLGNALYLSVVTVTTVGYGDIAPHTVAGKVVAVVFIITGVGAFTGVIAHITESMVIGREEDFKREKLKMIVSELYSEVGTRLIGMLVPADPRIAKMRPVLAVDDSWDRARFGAAARDLQSRDFAIESRLIDLPEMRLVLGAKAELFLRILESPSLGNDTQLADLVRAVLHLKDELLYRDDFTNLPATDLDHLGGDLARAYRMLTLVWLQHMEYTKDHYAYLFSLAVRVNPYKERPSAVIGA